MKSVSSLSSIEDVNFVLFDIKVQHDRSAARVKIT